jgi:cytochrome c556
MKRTMRGMIGGALALVLGMGLVARSKADGDDEVPKDVREAIMKIADLIDKGKAEDAKKEAAAIAKKAGFDGNKPGSCESLMHAFAVRATKGFGVGDKPGMIKPDGIEAKIQVLGDEKKKLSDKTLKTEAADIKKLALISAAIGDICIEATPKKDDGKKKAADWKKWSQEMRDYGVKLADAAGKGSDAKSVSIAARNLDGSCTSCHEVYRK